MRTQGPLGESSLRVLDAVRAQQHDFPTLRSIGKAVGLSVTTTFHHVHRLENMGYLAFEGIAPHKRLRVLPEPFTIEEWDALESGTVL